MGIGNRLKKTIKEHHLTIKQLAEITNIPVNTLYSIVKRDSVHVRAETVQILADALSVSPSYLIGYDDQVIRPDQYSPDELRKIQSSAWSLYQTSNSSFLKHRLLLSFSSLNDEGQEKAVERVQELTEIPRYRCAPEPPETHTETPEGQSGHSGE